MDFLKMTDWILSAETRELSPQDFASSIAAELKRTNVPVQYMSFSLPTMHPEIRADNLVWSDDTGAIVYPRSYDFMNSPGFSKSPLVKIFSGHPGFQRKLNVPLSPDDYPVLHDLQASGHTDYMIEPLQVTPTLRSYVSWSTRVEGGFSQSQYTQLSALTPYISVIVAGMSQSKSLEGLLDTYLGRQAGSLVRSGQYRRGDGNSIEAVIWFSDLRGFTTFTDQHPISDTLQRLNRSFDVIGKSIAEQGGEILKFIGDAVLAVFPVTASCTEKDAAHHALSAAKDAVQSLKETGPSDYAPIQIGVGLHRGVVTFGNVGTSNRLDFTVIGGPVNECARVESLCKSLKEDILLTDAIASLLPSESLRSLGVHTLRGVSATRQLFAVTTSL